MLLENSGIDNKKNNDFLNNFSLNYQNRILLFYVYYMFTIKSNIVLISSYNINNFIKITSLDKIYKSANWLERETSEMFRVSFNSKLDSRRLLLDYSKQENPLLKDYPTEGFNDSFYNFFEDQVVYNISSVIEL